LVTSAVRPIPAEWSQLKCLHLSVSVDGLQGEHDERRKPATYQRILKHIAGHRVAIHCTVTRPMLARPDYLAEFCRFWSARPETHRIWFSVYTPQEGEQFAERQRPEDREILFERLASVASQYSVVHLPGMVLDAYRDPPRSPEECTFARLTTCVSADLKTRIVPCQLGGKPVCGECGCMASAAMHAVGRVRLAGVAALPSILNVSMRVGGLAYHG
jgi:hypothetical protein